MSEVVLTAFEEMETPVVQIRDVVNTITGGCSTKKSDYINSGVLVLNKGHIKTYGVVETGSSPKHVSKEYACQNKLRLIQAGTVVVTLRDLSVKANFLGLVAVYKGGEPALITQGMYAIDLKENVDPKYFFYYANSPSYRIYVKKNKIGSTQVHLRNGQFLDAPIPLPNIEQQKRIVAKIEELFSHIDAGIEALNKAKQLLKQYRQSVLKAAVTGELTKEWREQRLKDDVQGSTSAAGAGSAGAAKLEPASQLLKRILKERRQKWEEQQLAQFKAKGKIPKNDKWKEKYKEPEECCESYNVPNGWSVCSFEQLILELKNGISKKPTEENGLAILRISAVRPMAVHVDDVRFLPNEFESNGFEIEDGDLLFTRYNGNPELVGVCGKVKGLDRKTVYPDKLMRAKPVSTEKISTNYLELSLNCGVSKDFIRSVTKTTAGQSGVAGGDVKKCPTILPPYEEQLVIADIVSEKIMSISRLDNEIDIQLENAGKNKQSILASAFSGRLV